MSLNTLPAFLDLWQSTLQWQPTTLQLSQFEQLYREVILVNQQLNLTRITDAADFWEKHLWDSLIGINPQIIDWHSELAVIDIGTGGGFPGIPVAITLPHSTLTLLDSTRKKIVFVRELATSLQLPRITTIVARAEETGQDPQHRNHYDLALIRAVASASVCAEYSLPLVKVGGTVVLYRGHWTELEQTQLTQAATLLGGKIEAVLPFLTPLTQSTRHCIYLRKIAPTPKIYPRRVGIPTQNPLGQV